MLSGKRGLYVKSQYKQTNVMKTLMIYAALNLALFSLLCHVVIKTHVSALSGFEN